MTAYNMRIIDWSSVVCSSDLFTGEARDAMMVTVREVSNIPEWYRSGFLDDQRGFREGEVNLLMRIRPELSRSEARYICTNVLQGDRKSIVSGKSVTVGGVVGGSRIMNKKIEKRYEMRT